MQASCGIKKNQAIQGVLSVLPVLFVIILIRAYPIMTTIIKSFTNWDGLSKNDWVGFSNYVYFFTTGEFWLMLRNSLFLLLYIPIQLFTGLVFAVLIYEEVFGWKFFRALSFLPQIISAVIIGYLFRILFSYDGPVNSFLNFIGLQSLAVEWLGNGITALVVIVICLVWQSLGWQALLFLGGMSSIHDSVIEAAIIDGAGYWKRLFKVILPMLVRVIEYSVIMSVMWVFIGLFPFIYSLTRGGPGYETTTLDYMVYAKAFITGNQLGSACAISVILLIIVLISTVIQTKLSDKAADWSE